jgi:acetylornithine deacetylase/succinyl-diaminopimelate desuccinylase-like protein
LLSAHLDTVFASGTDTNPREEEARILGPGACDNGAGLAGLLAIAAALRFAEIAPPLPILFAANTCEEGEGDLRGMRYLFAGGSYAGRIAAALPLEGSGTATAVTRALGSRRFRVTISGPGGHSWSDAATPNPITLVCRAIATLADIPTLSPTAASDETRTTLSPGQITGGTSINSIPESATVHLDLRSTEPAQLDHHAALIEQTFREIIDSTQNPEINLMFERIGDRPAAALPADSPLLDTLRAVDRHLNLRTELRLGSTDANIPLSLGVPAAALAAGGNGGGIHTLAEWYDPTGRETALRRILLILLDLTQTF